MINLYDLHSLPNTLDKYEMYGKTLSRLQYARNLGRFGSVDVKKEYSKYDWSPIHHILKTCVRYSYWYSNEVIKSRWLDAEPHLKTNHGYAYYYAKNVIKGRFIAAEPFIVCDSFYAYVYARDVIKHRWVEAEPHIQQNVVYWKQYCEKFEL